MGSAQVRFAWTSPTLTSCFKQSEPDSPPSPLNTTTCLTRSSTRRRKCPIPPKKEMETSSRPDRKLKRGSWTSSCESTSTSGGAEKTKRKTGQKKRDQGRAGKETSTTEERQR